MQIFLKINLQIVDRKGKFGVIYILQIDSLSHISPKVRGDVCGYIINHMQQVTASLEDKFDWMETGHWAGHQAGGAWASSSFQCGFMGEVNMLVRVQAVQVVALSAACQVIIPSVTSLNAFVKCLVITGPYAEVQGISINQRPKSEKFRSSTILYQFQQTMSFCPFWTLKYDQKCKKSLNLVFLLKYRTPDLPPSINRVILFSSLSKFFSQEN